MLTATLDPAPSLLARAATGRRVGVAGLLAAATLVAWAFSLSRSLFDPMGYDQALYQYMAERVMAGQRLYVDIWDQNTPGIVAIHWLSTCFVGSSPVALRVFDAVWQALTIAGLIGLAVRDGRNWPVGWLAAALYVLSYYSMGYVHTAQREGFTVLPLLMMVHLVLGRSLPESAPPQALPAAIRFFAAGALGLFVFSVKPPLGLAFGALWLYTLRQAASQRRQGVRAFTPPVALTAGFIIAAAVAMAWVLHVSTWDAFWGILSRRDIPGYVLGPALIRRILPGLTAGVVLLALVTVTVMRSRLRQGPSQAARLGAIACVLFVLLVSLRHWTDWRHIGIVFAGVWIPAAGSVLRGAWRGRSEAWRLMLLMLLAATAAMILQGQFFLYHVPPMLAPAAYLAAGEIAGRLRELPRPAPVRPAWLAVCAGCVAYLAVGQWWPTMTFVTAHPYVLADATLADHYTSITRHKLSCPTYATTIRLAGRLRESTGENEPIATLFHDVRVYYFARRPSVCRLVSMHAAYRHLFPEYMQAIRERRPNLIAARIPERLRDSHDLHAIQAAVLDETEAFFGPPGRAIRELYHVSELIDDVCLLRPNNHSPPTGETGEAL